MGYTTFRTAKFSWNTLEELVEQIGQLNAIKILSMNVATPDRTDTQNWTEVYYECEGE